MKLSTSIGKISISILVICIALFAITEVITVGEAIIVGAILLAVDSIEDIADAIKEPTQ